MLRTLINYCAEGMAPMRGAAYCRGLFYETMPESKGLNLMAYDSKWYEYALAGLCLLALAYRW